MTYSKIEHFFSDRGKCLGYIATLLFSALPLAAWWAWHDKGGCWLSFLLLLPVTGFMTLNMLETALMRRRALAGMYLRPQSFLARLLCRKSFLAAWQVIKAVVLALLLFMEAPAWPAWLWAVLGLDLLLLPVLYLWLQGWLAGQVRQGRRNILSRRLLLGLNTGILVGVLAVTQLFIPRADYTGLGWRETAIQAAEKVDTACDYLAPLVRLGAMRDALGSRLVQTLPRQGWPGLGAWLLYFLWSGLVFWAWSRLMLGGLGAGQALEYLEEKRCE